MDRCNSPARPLSPDATANRRLTRARKTCARLTDCQSIGDMTSRINTLPPNLRRAMSAYAGNTPESAELFLSTMEDYLQQYANKEPIWHNASNKGPRGGGGEFYCLIEGCSIKDNSFPTFQKAMAHLFAHWKLSLWQCLDCPSNYRSLNELNRHLNEKHQLPLPRQESDLKHTRSEEQTMKTSTERRSQSSSGHHEDTFHPYPMSYRPIAPRRAQSQPITGTNHSNLRVSTLPATYPAVPGPTTPASYSVTTGANGNWTPSPEDSFAGYPLTLGQSMPELVNPSPPLNDDPCSIPVLGQIQPPAPYLNNDTTCFWSDYVERRCECGIQVSAEQLYQPSTPFDPSGPSPGSESCDESNNNQVQMFHYMQGQLPPNYHHMQTQLTDAMQYPVTENPEENTWNNHSSTQCNRTRPKCTPEAEVGGRWYARWSPSARKDCFLYPDDRIIAFTDAFIPSDFLQKLIDSVLRAYAYWNHLLTPPVRLCRSYSTLLGCLLATTQCK